MSLRIDTQARIEAVRFQNQTGSPAAPAAGYSLIYVLPTGLYMETSGGAVIGPFVTGTAPAGGRTLIQELTPTGTTASFTSIPGTYKTLILEFMARSTQSAANVNGLIQFNTDSTDANYQFVEMESHGAASVGATGNTTRTFTTGICAATGPANAFTSGKIEIIQYANSTFHKSAKYLGAHLRDTSSIFEVNYMASTTWKNTAAITQIDIVLSAGNFVAGSVLRLYGDN